MINRNGKEMNQHDLFIAIYIVLLLMIFMIVWRFTLTFFKKTGPYTSYIIQAAFIQLILQRIVIINWFFYYMHINAILFIAGMISGSLICLSTEITLIILLLIKRQKLISS
jgi:hypothetical protein